MAAVKAKEGEGRGVGRLPELPELPPNRYMLSHVEDHGLLDQICCGRSAKSIARGLRNDIVVRENPATCLINCAIAAVEPKPNNEAHKSPHADWQVLTRACASVGSQP